MLTPEKQALIRESFALLKPDAGQAADRFYERLFQVEPGARPLFKHDIHLQAKKFMDMITWIVDHLETKDLGPALHDLGEKHATYGAMPDHYASVGSSLIWMFRHTLGQKFTPAMEEAWIDAYAEIASVMEDGGASSA
jgi:hemoglobin-like flavoprotein